MEITEIILLVVFSSIILILLSVLVVNLLLLGRNRRLKHQNQLLEVQANFEQALSKTQLEVAEQTMNDTARDLHDDVSQMLTFSIIQLNQLGDISDIALKDNIEKAKDAVKQSLQSIRNISKTLSTDYLSSFGINNALQVVKERINKHAQISCELDIDSKIHFENKAKELFLFRIIQELVSNSLKHADASKISISIQAKDNFIEMIYSDNGKGFDLSKINLSAGLGISNLQKRAALLESKIELESTINKGFKASLTINNLASQ